MKQRMFDLGYDYSIQSELGPHRFATPTRRLIRTNRGHRNANQRQARFTTSGNPVSAWWPIQYLGSGLSDDTEGEASYDAIELRLDQRFAKNYQYAASYNLVAPTGTIRVWPVLMKTAAPAEREPVLRTCLGSLYTEKGVMADGPLATDARIPSNSSAPIPQQQAGRNHVRPSCSVLVRQSSNQPDQCGIVDGRSILRPRRHGPDVGLLQTRPQPHARVQNRSPTMRR